MMPIKVLERGWTRATPLRHTYLLLSGKRRRKKFKPYLLEQRRAYVKYPPR